MVKHQTRMFAIAARVFQFHNFVIMHHLLKYHNEIITDMKWPICDRPENLRNGMVSEQFSMKLLSQVLTCYLSLDSIHAIRSINTSKRITQPSCLLPFSSTTRHAVFLCIKKSLSSMKSTPLVCFFQTS